MRAVGPLLSSVKLHLHLISMYRFAVVVLMCSCLRSVDSLTHTRIPYIFYPFGTDQGDQVATTSDDLSVPVSVGGNVPFCTLTYNMIYLNTNGFISFGRDYEEYSAVAFPIPTCSMLAVYWAYADTRFNNGRVYYRTVNAATNPLLAQASRVIRTAFTSLGFFDFQARWLFIATWHNVTFFGGNATTQTNSFQVVIATDWFNSFAMFNMTWTHGTKSDVLAEVGYNCPDDQTCEAFPTSRTDAIVRIGTETNVGEKGRLMYRLDSSDGSGCVLPPISATALWHSGRTLSGHTIINRLWIEYYCTVNTTVTVSRARFNVTFYSDTDVIYNATATPTDTCVTLDERYLLGRLGKRAFISRVRATETDPEPVQLYTNSTLPITCQEQDISGHPINCQLVFDVFVSSNDIAVRQRLNDEVKHCMFTYSEADWKPSESRAYNASAPLEIRAKIDLFLASSRYSDIHFSTKQSKLMAMRKVNGTSYPKILTYYSVRVAQVNHIGSPSALVKCTAGDDPQVMTFDGLSYTTLTQGEFTNARSIQGLPYEVQVRHGPCPHGWGQATSCIICSIAIREDNTILAADRCNEHDIIYQISYGMKEDVRGAGITISADVQSLMLLMPSGGKNLVDAWDGHMNIEVYVSEKIRTNGLCGTYDRNRTNDLNYQGSGRFASVGSNGYAPVEVIESWRVYPNASLFAGQRIALPRGDPEHESPLSFCTCALDQEPECSGPALADKTSSAWEPSFPVTAKGPEPTSPHARKRKAAVERSDIIDYYYNPAAFYGFLADRTTSAQWPTQRGVTESEARDTCTNRIVTSQFMGPSCYDALATSDVAAQVVQKCVSDFMIIDNLTSAANDKIPELQQACVNELVARNRSDISNTSEVMAEVISILPTVTAYKCEPYDCSGHGSWSSNGRCVCNAGYPNPPTDNRVAKVATPAVIPGVILNVVVIVVVVVYAIKRSTTKRLTKNSWSWTTILPLILNVQLAYGTYTVAVAEGGTARLDCKTTIRSLVDWKYMFDPRIPGRYIVVGGRLIKKYTPRFEFDNNTYALSIHNVSINESGLYYCVEDKGFGQQHFVQLNVDQPQRKLLEIDDGHSYSSDKQRQVSNAVEGAHSYGNVTTIVVPCVVALVVLVALVVVAIVVFTQRSKGHSRVPLMNL